jgi:hypothetical protein
VHALGPPADGPVDSFAITGVDQVDGELDQVLHPAARFFQQHADVGHGLLGLRGGVADAHGLAGVEVLADLATDIDGAVGDDGLAEIVVEALLGVCVARVERADAAVDSHFVAFLGEVVG